MRVCHGFTAEFDDPNLVSAAGLAPVLALAERVGLHRLADQHLTVPAAAGATAGLKAASLVGGMVAGADSIEDMDLLRHGGMGRLFAGVRAPSTLGSFLRGLRFGHIRQLDAVASRVLVNLAGHTSLLPGVGEVAYVDVERDQRTVVEVLGAYVRQHTDPTQRRRRHSHQIGRRVRDGLAGGTASRRCAVTSGKGTFP